MVTTWKSSLRDSIYNLYIAEPRTSKNRGKKKKKKPETEREVREQRPGSRACIRMAWVACETQAAHRARPIVQLRPRRTLPGQDLGRARDPGRAPCATRRVTQAASRVDWVRPESRCGSRARTSARPVARRLGTTQAAPRQWATQAVSDQI